MSDEKDFFDFRNEIEKASWELLESHNTSGALFVVEPHLDLVTVANAMAKDRVNVIKIWLDNGEIRRVTEEEVSDWEKEPTKNFADFLIVQPYVLMQLPQKS
jgi:hypothetical protein